MRETRSKAKLTKDKVPESATKTTKQAKTSAGDLSMKGKACKETSPESTSATKMAQSKMQVTKKTGRESLESKISQL